MLLTSYELVNLFEIKKVYPHGYHWIDNLGRSVHIERYNLIDMKKLFKITKQVQMIKYYIKQYEKRIKFIFPSCSEIVKKLVEQFCTFLDLEKKSFLQYLDLLKALLNLLDI